MGTIAGNTRESKELVGVDRAVGARRYCLFCFQTLPEGSNRCAGCQKITRPLDYREYWNKNPRIRSIEETIKVLTVVLTGLLVFLFFGVVGPGVGGTRSGWFFLLPLLPAVGIWKSASALTRAQPYFQPKVFWLAVFILLGLLLVFVHWFLVTIPLVCTVGYCWLLGTCAGGSGS